MAKFKSTGGETMAGKIAVIAGVSASLFLAGCSVFGYRAGTEEPAYSVVAHVGPLEIRRYGERLAVETVVGGSDVADARNAGFKILADYIFGNNQAKTKIAMTAPVAQSSQRIAMTAPVSQQHTAEGWRMKFFLPRYLTLATAPKPNNDKVRLATVPAEDYAVLRFSGSRDGPAVQAHITKLEAALKASQWQAVDEPVAWFYDPPWTLPFLRRNEVAVEVRRAGTS